MIVNDTIISVALAGIGAGIGWCLKKLNTLAIDVALIKQRLKMED